MHVFISAAETKAHMHPFAPASQTQGYRDMLESLECPGCAQAISCDVEVKHGGPTMAIWEWVKTYEIAMVLDNQHPFTSYY